MSAHASYQVSCKSSRVSSVVNLGFLTGHQLHHKASSSHALASQLYSLIAELGSINLCILPGHVCGHSPIILQQRIALLGLLYRQS
jgi:hypothetical protein